MACRRPHLAAHFTVVATDLAGYGASLHPDPADDHRPHSKREMARDQVQAMVALGFERFAVAGHDRGGRVAYRMALDTPERVSALAVLDIVPTADVWARADARLPLVYWHWGFLAQPPPLPERLIGAAPEEADRGRRIECPVLVLWGQRGALEPLYGDVLDVWRSWAPHAQGRALDATHFLVEDRPEELGEELVAFCGG